MSIKKKHLDRYKREADSPRQRVYHNRVGTYPGREYRFYTNTVNREECIARETEACRVLLERDPEFHIAPRAFSICGTELHNHVAIWYKIET